MRSYFASVSLPQNEVAEATVLLFEKELQTGYQTLSGNQVTLTWLIDQTEIYIDLPGQSTRLRNQVNPGVTVLIQGNEAGKFLETQKSNLHRPWHKKEQAGEWGRNLLIFFGIIGLLAAVYLLTVPWMAGKIASRVSIHHEAKLGDAVYDALSLDALEDRVSTNLLVEFFDEMNIQTQYSVRVSVVEGSDVNAFALPGGRIVVYKALLGQLEHYTELAALLSHEYIHVSNKHTTKSIFRKLGSRVFLAFVFGNLSSVTSVMIDHADNLKSLNYSRALEKEADLEGLKILQQRFIDPNGFAGLFRHLKLSVPESSLPEFLGSHPDIDKRIAYISEFSKGSVVREDNELKVIFEKLKQNIKQ